jgi:hypothetical protein
MKKEEQSYIYLILYHAFLGVVVFALPFLSKLYTLAIFSFGVYYIVKSRNRNNEALIMSAYVVGIEVLLRMTDGMLLNEFGKYSILSFMFLGMVYSGFSKNAWMYWGFLLLLVPGIIVSTLSFTFDRLKGIITAFCLPLVSIVVYLFLYTPSVKDVVTGTASNFETSGGFGPNQMSTILGLGIFVFFVQLLLNSKSRLLQILNVGFVMVFAFRGLVTFSRGGIMTAVLMICLLVTVLYFRANFIMRPKIGLIIMLSFLAGLGVFGYSSIQTRGLINKRYANEDARGREKKSKLSGRENLISSELRMFLDNPLFGVGVGRNKEIRQKETGIVAASHNEITRMLAEHGSLGLIGLIILLFTPLLLFVNNRQNVLAFSFVAFWLLTINHAAMRLAAPAFVYALSLLKVYTVEPATVSRQKVK